MVSNPANRRPSSTPVSPVNNGNDGSPEPVAIIGMAMKLPGQNNDAETLWDFLMKKSDAGGPVPPNRYNSDAFYSPSKRPGTIITQRGYFLHDNDGIDKLDASFFSMSAAEVPKLDPQQRMLLEVAYECFENAGLKEYRGQRIGTYVGTFGEDAQDMGAKDTLLTGLYRVAGAGDWALPNRVGFEFNLTGPSVTMQGACSSSLTCLDQAVRGIQQGLCDGALVCGTSLIMTPTMSIAMTEQGVLSADGSCKTFDESANGYARAEAINAILIKPLSAAIRDGDKIRAVIRGSAINADGKTPGFTDPSAEAHEAMIRLAYQQAGLDPHETAYVECHGTGTGVGDPIETSAIANVFAGHGKHPVFISSVKTVLGHAEAASGLNAVIKATLALEHKTIPPHIKCVNPSKKINWDAGLRVPLEATPWPIVKHRASVNSFGIGGSNAHVILESFESYKQSQPSRKISNALIQKSASANSADQVDDKVTLLLISAHNGYSLTESIAAQLKYLKENPSQLQNLAYTLAHRRRGHGYRAYASIVASPQGLPSSAPKFSAAVKMLAALPELIFIFTGQGFQTVQMGYSLITDFPSFAEDVREMDAVLQSLPNPPDWHIEKELSNGPAKSRVTEAEWSQPLCTVIQIGMFNLLRSYGVKPKATIGHSSGEIAAAYAAGRLTMREAVIVAFYRGQNTNINPVAGGMAAVRLSFQDAEPFLEKGKLVCACENSQESTTISGDMDALDRLVEKFKTEGKWIVKLPVKNAYHSHHMLGYGQPYEDLLKTQIKAEVTKSDVLFFSSVSGKLWADATGPSYWRQNLENPVLFSTAVTACLATKTGAPHLFLELGPHSGFKGPLRTICEKVKASYSYVSCLTQKAPQTECMLNAVGELWGRGFDVDMSKIVTHGEMLTDLPKYPWDHEASHWFESRVSRDWRLRKFNPHELLGNRTMDGNGLHPEWRNILNLKDIPWVTDHKVQTDVLFPFAGYVAMAGEAIRQLHGVDSYVLRNLTVNAGCVLNEDESTEIMTSFNPVFVTSTTKSEWWNFEICSLSGGGWVSHASGQVKGGIDHATKPVEVSDLPRSIRNPYPGMAAVGLNYGPQFQGLTKVSCLPAGMTAAATLKNPPTTECFYSVHPTNIDHCLQLILTAQSDGLARKITQLYVPTSIGELYIGGGHDSIDIKALAHAGKVATGLTGDVTAMVGDKVVVSLTGGKFSPVPVQDDSANDRIAGGRLTVKPDLDFADVKNLIKPSSSTRKDLMRLEEYSLAIIFEIREKIKGVKVNTDPNLNVPLPHLEKFRAWITKQIARAEKGTFPVLPDGGKEVASWSSSTRAIKLVELRSTFSETESVFPAVLQVNRILDHIVDIFQGIQEPLAVIIEGDKLTPYYDWLWGRTTATEFFELLGHLKPGLRVLEIGAGTGGTTLSVFTGLQQAAGTGQNRMYSSYTYTDISPAFFEKAKERFESYPSMVYKALNIKNSIVDQGFEPGSFDLIVAANVIHAGESLNLALTNIRELLAPGGRLFLQELDAAAENVNLVMGVLGDWWLGDGDNRFDEPYVDPDRWTIEFDKAGLVFESVCHDDIKPYQLNANYIARPKADTITTPQAKEKITLLVEGDTASNAMCSAFERVLSNSGIDFEYCTLGEKPKKQNIISLIEIETPFFANLDETKFDKLKALFGYLTELEVGMLWVTGSSKNPELGMVFGFRRTLGYELPTVPFATVALDSLSSRTIKSIAPIYSKWSKKASNSDVDPESEWTVSADGTISIGRYQSVHVEGQLASAITTVEKKLAIASFKQLATLKWSPMRVRSCGHGEIVISNKAIGINQHDVEVGQGLIDGSLGHEGAGIVEEVGKDVKHVFVGDRVMFIGFDTFATTSVIPGLQAIKIPDTLTFEQAATMPFAFVTTIHALLSIGHMDDDYSVLLHNAHEGVGLAALQLCKDVLACKVFVTTTDDEKKAWLKSTFDLAEDVIFSSTDDSFLAAVSIATHGQGVDFVLNNLSGELLATSWNCVADGGKFVELGKKDITGQGQLQLERFDGNKSFQSVDVSHLQPKRIQRLLVNVMKYLNAGKIQPLEPVDVYGQDDIVDAFTSATEGNSVGKTVITIEKESPAKGSDLDAGYLILDPSKAYLLVGGLGGIGRALSAYLIEHGARHLVFLGRSAGTPDDLIFQNELELQGCTVQFVKGSVTVFADVERCVATSTKKIAGVFQLSMVLRDGNFAEMSYQWWMDAVTPKLDGTWNLHNALGKELDFFVCTSSISGSFGNAGQANYAAGNSFIDDFILYRHSQGLNASVLDVGVVGEIGYLADAGNSAVQDALMNAGAYALRELDILESFKWAMLNSRPDQVGQLAIGIRTTVPLGSDACRVNWKRDPRMAAYRNAEGAVKVAASGNSIFATLVPALAGNPSLIDDEATRAEVKKAVGEKILVLMNQSVEDLDYNITLTQLNVDSLATIEIKGWITRVTTGLGGRPGFVFSTIQLMSVGSIGAVGELVLTHMKKRVSGEPDEAAEKKA